MKTKVGKRIVNLYESFDMNTSDREDTMEFAEGFISRKEWIEGRWDKEVKKTAKLMIAKLGVKKARQRLCRWFNRDYGDWKR